VEQPTRKVLSVVGDLRSQYDLGMSIQDGLHQLRNELGIIIQVGVHQNNQISLNFVKASQDCWVLAKVAT
jgi:hypothetical protein